MNTYNTLQEWHDAGIAYNTRTVSGNCTRWCNKQKDWNDFDKLWGLCKNIPDFLFLINSNLDYIKQGSSDRIFDISVESLSLAISVSCFTPDQARKFHESCDMCYQLLQQNSSRTKNNIDECVLNLLKTYLSCM